MEHIFLLYLNINKSYIYIYYILLHTILATFIEQNTTVFSFLTYCVESIKVKSKS